MKDCQLFLGGSLALGCSAVVVAERNGRDETSGAYCGVDFFENRAAPATVREPELARTIATGYEAEEVRPEVYDVLYPLRPERGPLAELACKGVEVVAVTNGRMTFGT